MSHVHFTNSMSHVHVTNSMQTIYVGDQRVMYGSTIQWRIYETNESCTCHELNADNVCRRPTSHLSFTREWLSKVSVTNSMRNMSHENVTSSMRNIRDQRVICQLRMTITGICHELNEEYWRSISDVHATNSVRTVGNQWAMFTLLAGKNAYCRRVLRCFRIICALRSWREITHSARSRGH